MAGFYGGLGLTILGLVLLGVALLRGSVRSIPRGVLALVGVVAVVVGLLLTWTSLGSFLFP